MNYYVDMDWGAAIINTGLVVCTDCVFTNNFAKNGGAIFYQGLLILNNTEFANNKSYGKGNDICNGNGGLLIINGENITQDTANICFAESLSAENVAVIAFIVTGVAVIEGTIAAVVSANAFIGSAIGAGVGALVGLGGGLLASAYIISVT